MAGGGDVVVDSLPPLDVGGILEFGDTTFGFIDV